MSAYRKSLRRGTFILKAIKQLSEQDRNGGRLHCSCLVNILPEVPLPVRNDTTPTPISCRWSRFWGSSFFWDVARRRMVGGYRHFGTTYRGVSQPLWDRGPINPFFIRRGPGPNKFTRKYLSNFLSSYIKPTQVLLINYGIIIKSISTLMYTVWHVDKYKITFKLVINWTNEIL